MKYRKHLEFAQSIVAALPPEVTPEVKTAAVFVTNKMLKKEIRGKI